MSDSETQVVEAEDWEERKKQARLRNLEKAREAAKAKRQSVVVKPVEEPKEPERKPILKPRRVRKVEFTQPPKRSRDENEPEDAGFGTKALQHLGGFLLTVVSLAISTTLPTIIAGYRDSAKMGAGFNNPAPRHVNAISPGNDLFDGQSIFY
jgi:hypothetical protein